MDCAKAGQEGVEGAPLYLADTEARGLEWSCDIWGVEPGMVAQSWQLSMTCSAEGETYEDNQLILLEDSQRLHVWSAFDGAGYLVSYGKCQ